MNAQTTHRPHRRYYLWLAGSLLAGVLLLSLLARQTSVARWLERLPGLESDSYKVYPTATAPQDFYGRVFAKIRTRPIKMEAADNPENASALVGFRVRSPQYLPEGFEPLNRYIISGEHAYEIAIHFDEARRILDSAGLPSGSLPVATVIDKIDVDIPASVVVNQNQGERWFTLIQSTEAQVELPQDIDPTSLQTLNELGLRYLGLTQPEAHQFNQDMGWAYFLVTPPADMFHAEQTVVNGVPALVLYQSQTDNGHTAVLWKAGGMLYGLYGGLPVDELLKIAESMG